MLRMFSLFNVTVCRLYKQYSSGLSPPQTALWRSYPAQKGGNWREEKFELHGNWREKKFELRGEYCMGREKKGSLLVSSLLRSRY